MVPTRVAPFIHGTPEVRQGKAREDNSQVLPSTNWCSGPSVGSPKRRVPRWRRESRVSEFPESHADLLDAPVGILSTVGSTGIPQTTPIWFIHDGGELRSWLSDARQKVKNLLARPEFSFLILDAANPQRYLVVRGRAELEPDTEFALGAKMGDKYGVDLRRMIAEGETRYAITFVPRSIAVR